MKLVRLYSKLNDIHKAIPLSLISFEAARNAKNANTVRALSEMQGILKLWVEKHKGVELAPFSAGQIKKHATGSGSASKDDMIAAATKNHPDVEIIDDNHADALCLLDLTIDWYGEKD